MTRCNCAASFILLFVSFLSGYASVVALVPLRLNFSPLPPLPAWPRCGSARAKRRRYRGTTNPVDVVGHSMGGLAALAYAIDHPEKVKRLVLVGTGCGGRAYKGAVGAFWNRSHPAFWRMALLGTLHLAWPARGPREN